MNKARPFCIAKREVWEARSRCVGGFAEQPSQRSEAKADVDGEELVRCTRRTAGTSGAHSRKERRTKAGRSR
jgi:hypothetical protein